MFGIRRHASDSLVGFQKYASGKMFGLTRHTMKYVYGTPRIKSQAVLGKPRLNIYYQVVYLVIINQHLKACFRDYDPQYRAYLIIYVYVRHHKTCVGMIVRHYKAR